LSDMISQLSALKTFYSNATIAGGFANDSMIVQNAFNSTVAGIVDGAIGTELFTERDNLARDLIPVSVSDLSSRIHAGSVDLDSTVARILRLNSMNVSTTPQIDSLVAISKFMNASASLSSLTNQELGVVRSAFLNLHNATLGVIRGELANIANLTRSLSFAGYDNLDIAGNATRILRNITLSPLKAKIIPVSATRSIEPAVNSLLNAVGKYKEYVVAEESKLAQLSSGGLSSGSTKLSTADGLLDLIQKLTRATGTSASAGIADAISNFQSVIGRGHNGGPVDSFANQTARALGDSLAVLEAADKAKSFLEEAMVASQAARADTAQSVLNRANAAADLVAISLANATDTVRSSSSLGTNLEPLVTLGQTAQTIITEFMLLSESQKRSMDMILRATGGFDANLVHELITGLLAINKAHAEVRRNVDGVTGTVGRVDDELSRMRSEIGDATQNFFAQTSVVEQGSMIQPLERLAVTDTTTPETDLNSAVTDVENMIKSAGGEIH
jgi:hypothetical protein